VSEGGATLTVNSRQDELYHQAAVSSGPAIEGLAHPYEADPRNPSRSRRKFIALCGAVCSFRWIPYASGCTALHTMSRLHL
jgi:hypothetical protein